MRKCRIDFIDAKHPSVELASGSCLSEYLNAQNSPLLFGCRIGICGTCAVEVGLEDNAGQNIGKDNDQAVLSQRTAIEDEFLQEMAPAHPRYRLACQIHVENNMTLKKVEI